jgi:hypothetical protein
MGGGDVSDWNPRFALYARAQGRTPQEQLDHDREEWTGCMCGFILWMAPRIQRFKIECPEYCVGKGSNATIHDQEAFDRWLEAHT